MIRKLLLVAGILGSGCYHVAGGIIADAHLDQQGKLHTTRCNLVVGTSLLTIGWGDHLDDCQDDTGKPVHSPPSLEERTSR